MPDLRRISSASVLLVLVLVLGWAGAGIPRCGVTQFRSQTRHRPARPARVPVTSCPHPANQRPVSRPRPANHRPRFSRAPRCLWPVVGAVRAVPATRRAAPLPGRGGRSQHRASARAARSTHAEQLVTAAPLLLLLVAGPSLDTGDTAAALTTVARYVECREWSWAASACTQHTKPGKSGDVLQRGAGRSLAIVASPCCYI